MHYPDTWATYISSTSTILYINTIRGLFQLQNRCSDICQTLHGASSCIILIHELHILSTSTILYINMIRGLFHLQNSCSDICQTLHGKSSCIILIHDLHEVKIFCPQTVKLPKINCHCRLLCILAAIFTVKRKWVAQAQLTGDISH